MDIRFTNRWGGLSYSELYYILDGLIGIREHGTSYYDLTPEQAKFINSLIREVNQEMIRRKKEEASYEDPC